MQVHIVLQEKSQNMKHQIFYTRFLLLSSVIWLASCQGKSSKSQSTGAASTPALSVDVQVVKEQTTAQLDVAAGSLLPNKSVNVISELSRRVVRVLFRDGSNVREGQLLYQLDDADIRARMRETQAELNLAFTTEKRLSELLKTGTIRQDEYDAAFARSQSLQARLDQLQIEQRKTAIRAPFSGTIGMSKVFAGAFVGPGIPMVDIHQQSQLKVSFSVPEKYLAYLQPGTKISFTTNVSTDTMSAKVVSMDASVNVDSRNILVHALAGNPNNRLKAGMSVKVRFSTSSQSTQSHLAVPTGSLIPGESGFSVFVVKNGVAKISPIEVANRNEREAIVSGGLAKGDTVLISNIMRAADGVPVSIVNIN